jgi:peptidoglycan/xylan/chitin deacetylase (PgdA/CDA1 family)
MQNDEIREGTCMIGYDSLRKLNRRFKQAKKERAGKFLSPVRRIERVYPPTSKRICAMTFDDGPSALPPSPDVQSCGKGLTETLNDTLRAYGASGTFDVIGTTAGNYPDQRGKLHSASWGGRKHDHYPDFEKDALAGAANQPSLVKMLAESGHQLANHGYRHVLFGRNRLIYGQRETFKNLIEVVDDLTLLEDAVAEITGSGMRFARPPHYIDKIKDGYDAYDAYAIMGYHYMAASYDGGGWMPSSGNYEKDVEAMVAPMRALLERDPNALNGQIIFQKDGCNMSLQTPIADALSKQLALLESYDYEVVSVETLLKISPFEDFGEGMPGFESARRMDNAGFIVGYRNNTFQPSRKITIGELITMVTPRDYYKMLREELLSEPRDKRLNLRKYRSSYAKHLTYARSMGYLNRIGTVNAEAEVSMEFMIDFIGGVAKAVGSDCAYVKEPAGATYTRAEAVDILAAVMPGCKC